MRNFWMMLAFLLATAAMIVPAESSKPFTRPLPKDVLAEARVARTASALSPEDVAAWLDGFMPVALATGDIAGAQVAIVDDGKIIALKGYGYADTKRRIAVDPEKHLFRPGSISKLFTWIAVMQLVEQGKVDLDRDVNAYLDFRIPPRPDGAITMRHLMTHTPGFEDAVRALITPHPANVGLERTLKRWTPKRIYPAGSTPAYSNYGTGLAGYIVERVSGMSFDNYVEQRIFAPLKMESSSFRQPLPGALAKRMTKGYVTASGEPLPYEYISLPPVGALAAPASDMAKFLIAMLDRREPGRSGILRTETLRMMHGTRAAGFPRLNAMLLGFFENDLNGRKVVAHSGDTTQFHSELNLFIEDGAGIYVSFNSLGTDAASVDMRTALVRAFADRYFPRSRPSAAAERDGETVSRHAAMVAARYDNSRRSVTSFLAGLGLLAQAKIIDNGDGTISFPAMTDLAGQPKRWKEVAPFLWQEADGPERLAAKVVDGKVVRVGHSAYPYMVWEPAPWWRDSGWLLPLAQFALLVLVLTVALWPVRFMVRRSYNVEVNFSRPARLCRLGVHLCAIAVIGAVILWALLLQTLLNNLAPGSMFNTQVLVATLLMLIGSLAGLMLAICNILIARRERREWQFLLGNALLSSAFAIFLWVGFAFNLFSFSTQF